MIVEILFGGVVVPAIILPVAAPHIRRKVLSRPGIDIPGKYPFTVAGRAFVPAPYPLVFFQFVSVCHNSVFMLCPEKSFFLATFPTLRTLCETVYHVAMYVANVFLIFINILVISV